MDKELYRVLKTSRGFNYNVLYVAATTQTTTLLFLHGFPNSSYSWRHQVDFFTKAGYGVVVPDLLGYGGTDKPLETALYTGLAIAKDVVDVIDQLHVEGQLVAIGHDWGSKITARLANNHQDRFAAFAFLAVGYTAPNPLYGYQDIVEVTKKTMGRDIWGYWAFFSEDDADEVIRKHYDAFWGAFFAFEPETVKTIAATGGLRSYLHEDRQVPLPGYLSLDEAKVTKEAFWDSGLKAPLNWYKVMTSDLDKADVATIPKENYKINKPVFFGAALKDAIAVPAIFETTMSALIPELVIQKYDASHWLHWEKKDELNRDLKEWLGNLA